MSANNFNEIKNQPTMALSIFKGSKKYMLNISLYCILSAFLFPCKAQNQKNVINHLSLSHPYAFDNVEEIPFSSYLVKNIGQFAIIFLPNTNELKAYYHNFEKTNKIKPSYSELDDLYFYSKKQQKKINALLKEKIKKLTDYKVIGIFVSADYIDIDADNPEESSIGFPYQESIFLLNKDKTWRFIETKQIMNYEQEMIINTPAAYRKLK